MKQNTIYGHIAGNKPAKVLMLIGIFVMFLGILISCGNTEDRPGRGFWDGLADPFNSSTNASNYAPIVYVGVFFLIAAGVTFLVLKGISLTVTDTYVTGSVAFGKSVNLPINQISAVAQGAFNKLIIATSSGSICFWFVENRDDICAFLKDRIGRQYVPPVTAQAPGVSASSADELKKFKALLDEGVITQEEFNEKKKKLMDM